MTNDNFIDGLIFAIVALSGFNGVVALVFVYRLLTAMEALIELCDNIKTFLISTERMRRNRYTKD